MNFEIVPHPLAPHFSDTKNAQLYIQQLMREADSPNFNPNEEARTLFREAGLVNLWFFLKFIAAYSGPFELLNDTLHLDMCNFRQSLVKPGSRGAICISRSFYKTTIFTVGGDAWEGIRNPNIRICIFNAIVGKAEEFLHTVQRIFDSNEFFAWLYPEHVPNGSTKWNDSVGVLPSRTRTFTEPTFRVGSVGGASEGGHFDVLSMDDLVGLGQLNSESQSNTEMETTTKWFRSSKRTLLMTQQSRIVAAFTRYAVDDTYEEIMQDMKEYIGYEEVLELGHYEVKKDGVWRVYYRCAEEFDKAICPEIMPLSELRKMEEEDPWTFLTQYQNLPQASGLTEFSNQTVKKFQLEANVLSESMTEWYVTFTRMNEDGKEELVKIPLSSMDIVGGVDPAGTEKYMTARTSKTAIAVWAEDCYQNKYFIDGVRDYFSIYQMFDEIFRINDKFKGYIRSWRFESNAYQRVLKQVGDREKQQRGKYIYFEPVPAVGDKVIRIRGILGNELESQRIWVNEGNAQGFLSELRVFPQNRYRMDFLDASVHAITGLSTPLSEDDEAVKESQLQEFVMGTAGNDAGY